MVHRGGHWRPRPPVGRGVNARGRCHRGSRVVWYREGSGGG